MNEEIKADLDSCLDLAYGLSFILTLDDQRSSQLVMEGLDLFFLRSEEFLAVSRSRLEVRCRLLNCLYRAFLARKLSNIHQGHAHERSRMLEELDPIVRGMLFLKHKAKFDYEDLEVVFERDSVSILNDVALGREQIGSYLGGKREQESLWN
jgi:hypothetical protein